MKKLFSATQIIARLCEIAHWIGAGVLLVVFILTLLPGNLIAGAVSDLTPLEAMEVYGFEMIISDAAGSLDVGAIRLFSLVGFLLLGLMAMVFRNVNLCLKTAQGKTKFAQGATPFQGDITRMVREMGIFLLGVVVLGFLFAAVGGVIFTPDTVHAELDVTKVVVGLLLLCLSQVFQEGESLRKDADGLV